MSTVASSLPESAADPSSSKSLASVIDRWIYVFMAVWFIAIVLTGFIPDSLEKIAAVEAGQRPPFPFMLHAHAVLMGSFLLVLLAQTFLMATGRRDHHMTLGVAGMVLAPALVIVGILLVPTMYHEYVGMLQVVPPEVRPEVQQGITIFNNIMLLQIQVGVLFAVYITLALLARKTDSGLHKRMMFLAVALPLPAAFDRIMWLPNTMPDSPLAPLLYILLAVTPLFVWDVLRTRKVHKAYLIWLAGFAPSSILIYFLWNTDWWQATAPRLVGL